MNPILLYLVLLKATLSSFSGLSSLPAVRNDLVVQRPLITDRQLTAAWAQMLESFRAAAQLQPPVVINGRPDSTVLPSHLASQGFYLMRARTQLREIVDILQK